MTSLEDETEEALARLFLICNRKGLPRLALSDQRCAQYWARIGHATASCSILGLSRSEGGCKRAEQARGIFLLVGDIRRRTRNLRRLQTVLLSGGAGPLADAVPDVVLAKPLAYAGPSKHGPGNRTRTM